MRSLWNRNGPVADDHDLLDATLAVGQTQMLAQIADETALDGRTMGVLGFNGALLAADVAAKELLQRWWWTPLVAVGLATSLCLWSVLEQEANLGPLGTTFYRDYGSTSSVLGRKQLLADIGDAFEDNAARIKWKNRRLRIALGILLVGLVCAASLITFDQPDTIKAHGKHSATSPASQGSRVPTGTV